MVTFAKVLLLVGIMCLVLAVWSLLLGEFRDAGLGLALGLILLSYWRWELGKSG